MSAQHTGNGRPDPVDSDAGGASHGAASGASREATLSCGPDEAPVLPTRTADDTDTGWGERWRDEPDSDDERYLRERPPHWE
jgi:hypothetical protein